MGRSQTAALATTPDSFIKCNQNFLRRLAGLVPRGGAVADSSSISLFTPDGDSAWCKVSQHGLVWVTAYEDSYVSDDPGHYALFVFDGNTGLTELHKSANASLSTPWCGLWYCG